MPIQSKDENRAAALASRFINHTERHVFLTGKAGTGKTTFLRSIIKQTHKKAVIAAPTGIAAINAGGVTLHSLFQLPFGAFVPEKQASTLVANTKFNDPYTLIQNLNLGGNKRRLLQEIELLIIDEVSMLRADLLDAVDTVLRYVRRKNNVPFGGVQILFIGDLLQLPPVVKDEEWQVMQRYYNSQWFFDAHALQDQKPYYIELDKIYRQHDEDFINLLNNLRNNTYTDEDIALLNRYYKPDYRAQDDENIIYLCTHNYKANEINRSELAKLSGKSYFFKAEVDGDFNEYNYPLEETLELKPGAQVMFVKNDIGEDKRYFNGKIGKISELSNDVIKVDFGDGTEPVSVEKYTWENLKYKLNETTNEVDENVAGTFSHYPLKLAWAITVHKSQGLTFNKAIIDIGKAFAPGQVYVALSRLTGLDGLVLSSPINYNSISEDRSVVNYAKGKHTSDVLENALQSESADYLRNVTIQAFDFTELLRSLSSHLESYTKDEQKSAKQKFADWAKTLKSNLEPHKETADKFLNQLRQITNTQPVDLEKLHARLISAKNYFYPVLKDLSGQVLAHYSIVSKEKKIKTYLTELSTLESRFYKQMQIIDKALALVNSAIHKTELLVDDVRNKKELKQRETSINEQTQVKREKKPKLEKGKTQEESYLLYKQGKTIQEIAAIRGYALTTIEGHLARYIAFGELNIEDFLSREKYDKIAAAIEETGAEGLGPIKSVLGDDFSYTEIRFALAHYRTLIKV
ncbi:MAG: helix-turn-helix domain-containing protein [Bacteroidia bacterium]